MLPNYKSLRLAATAPACYSADSPRIFPSKDDKIKAIGISNAFAHQTAGILSKRKDARHVRKEAQKKTYYSRMHARCRYDRFSHMSCMFVHIQKRQ